MDNNINLTALNAAIVQNRENQQKQQPAPEVKQENKPDNSKKLLAALAGLGVTAAAGVAIYKHKMSGVQEEFQKLINQKDTLGLEEFKQKADSLKYLNKKQKAQIQDIISSREKITPTPKTEAINPVTNVQSRTESVAAESNKAETVVEPKVETVAEPKVEPKAEPAASEKVETQQQKPVAKQEQSVDLNNISSNISDVDIAYGDKSISNYEDIDNLFGMKLCKSDALKTSDGYLITRGRDRGINSYSAVKDNIKHTYISTDSGKHTIQITKDGHKASTDLTPNDDLWHSLHYDFGWDNFEKKFANFLDDGVVVETANSGKVFKDAQGITFEFPNGAAFKKTLQDDGTSVILMRKAKNADFQKINNKLAIEAIDTASPKISNEVWSDLHFYEGWDAFQEKFSNLKVGDVITTSDGAKISKNSECISVALKDGRSLRYYYDDPQMEAIVQRNGLGGEVVLSDRRANVKMPSDKASLDKYSANRQMLFDAMDYPDKIKDDSLKYPTYLYSRMSDDFYDAIRHTDSGQAYGLSKTSNKNIHKLTGESTENIKSHHEGGWHYRMSKKHNNKQVADRASLNVYPDDELISKLDDFALKHDCLNSYKTPQSLDGWTDRHDPITMYFNENITPEIEEELTRIVSPHIRKAPDDVMIGRKISDGIFEVKEPTYDDLRSLMKRAKELNFDDGLVNYLDMEGFKVSPWHGNFYVHSSAGIFESYKRIIDKAEQLQK